MSTQELADAVKAQEESEVKDLSQEEVKKIYKDLLHFRNSESYQKLVEEGNKNGEKLLEAIRKEFESRKIPKLEFSEANKLNSYITFYSDLSKKLDDSEGANIIKKELDKQIQNGLSHLYCKVELGFDAPTFTKLDMLKNLRNINMTIDKKVGEIVSLYTPTADEKESLHPYEEVNN